MLLTTLVSAQPSHGIVQIMAANGNQFSSPVPVTPQSSGSELMVTPVSKRLRLCGSSDSSSSDSDIETFAFKDFVDKFFERLPQGGFKCRSPSCTSRSKVYRTKKLSNLKRHVQACDKDAMQAYQKACTTVIRGDPTAHEIPYVRVRMDYEELMKCCIGICTTHGHPLSSIDECCFQRLIRPYLDALPGRKVINSQIVRSEILVRAAELKAKIRRRLMGKNVCLKMDCATRGLTSFIGVYAQYIEEGDIRVQLLRALPMVEKHTAVNLKGKMVDTISDYGLRIQEVFSSTTDNGANVVKMSKLLDAESMGLQEAAVETLEEMTAEEDGDEDCDSDEEDSDAEEELEAQFELFEDDVVSEDEEEEIMRNHEEAVDKMNEATFTLGILIILCAAHTLQLAVMDAIKNSNFGPLIRKGKKTAKKLRNQTNAALLKVLGAAKPIVSNATRWSSIFAMIDRLLQLKKTMKDHFPRLYDEWTAEEWEQLEELRNSLRPCTLATIKLQKENLPFSETLPIFIQCMHEVEQSTGSFSQILHASLKKRSEAIFTDELFAAVLLDRRFLLLLDEAQVKKGTERLVSIYEKITANQERRGSEKAQPTQAPTPAPPGAKPDILAEIMKRNSSQRCFSKETEPQTPSEVIRDRLTRYIERTGKEEPLPRTTNILQHWENEKFKMPELYELAKVVLAIPATQVSVERLFSNLKFILSDQRMRMSDELLEAILLLRMEAKVEAAERKGRKKRRRLQRHTVCT